MAVFIPLILNYLFMKKMHGAKKIFHTRIVEIKLAITLLLTESYFTYSNGIILFTLLFSAHSNI